MFHISHGHAQEGVYFDDTSIRKFVVNIALSFQSVLLTDLLFETFKILLKILRLIDWYCLWLFINIGL